MKLNENHYCMNHYIIQCPDKDCNNNTSLYCKFGTIFQDEDDNCIKFICSVEGHKENELICPIAEKDNNTLCFIIPPSNIDDGAILDAEYVELPLDSTAVECVECGTHGVLRDFLKISNSETIKKEK